MRLIFVPLLLTGLAVVGMTAVQAADKIDPKTGCKIVEQKSGQGNSGTLSSSVTAGGGKVSGHTTGAGNSVTVHSSDGSTSSSVATSGSSGGSSVVAGSGSGDCTITINRNK
jgi:hypothetical protein